MRSSRPWAPLAPAPEEAVPLIRDSDLADERSRIRGDVDGVLLERNERNDLKRPFMGGRQHYVGGCAVLMRPQPVQRGHAPAVTGREPREVVLRHGCDQVVADMTLVLEEGGRDHRADRVASPILRTGTTAPVTVKAGEGVDATRLKLATEHVTFGHRPSIAWQMSRCRAPEALASRAIRERPVIACLPAVGSPDLPEAPRPSMSSSCLLDAGWRAPLGHCQDEKCGRSPCLAGRSRRLVVAVQGAGGQQGHGCASRSLRL